ncbi:MAG: hypothetical protein AAB653_01505, partial [Patescibacteria group bacterium]
MIENVLESVVEKEEDQEQKEDREQEIITPEDFNVVLDYVGKELREELKTSLNEKIIIKNFKETKEELLEVPQFEKTVKEYIDIFIDEFKKNYIEIKKQYKEIAEKIIQETSGMDEEQWDRADKKTKADLFEKWKKTEKTEKLNLLKEHIKSKFKKIGPIQKIIEKTKRERATEETKLSPKAILSPKERLEKEISDEYATRFPEDKKEFNMRIDLLDRFLNDWRNSKLKTLPEKEELIKQIEEAVDRIKRVKERNELKKEILDEYATRFPENKEEFNMRIDLLDRFLNDWR